MKELDIYISKMGRKYSYIGVYGKKSSHPVVYFRKSKWATQEEFETVLNYILETLKQTKGEEEK